MHEMSFENFALNCEMKSNRVAGIKNDQPFFQYLFCKSAHDNLEAYRKVCFECIDHFVNSIETRFNQPDCQIYLQMQGLLLKSFHRESWNGEIAGLSQI